MEEKRGPAAKKRAARGKCRRKIFRITLLTVMLMGLMTVPSMAAPADLVQSLLGGSDSQALRIILELSLIALLPTLLIMLTGFTRIVIVLSMVRNAIGLQNMPPNTVIIGLSLFLTYFVMSPILTQVSNTALEPYINEQITYQQFYERSMVPFRDFMFKQTYKGDLNYFCDLGGVTKDGKTVKDLNVIPNRVLISAFITSELKHAFAIGLFLYIPFVVIDMVVASTLMAMGMMMLPPATISLPFKIMLFVLVDGWQLTIGTLIHSFGG